MKVTGWTYWGDPNYIDVYHKGMEMRANAMDKAIKFPTREEFSQMTEEEQVSYFTKHREQIDKLLDTDEIHEINNLCQECYNTVLECVRDNGYHFTGDMHQNADCGVPIIDDKYIVCLSQRTWGGLIANAFTNEIDNSEGYGYIKWDWTVSDEDKDKVKMPNEK